MNNSIGQNIKQLRKAKNLTQEELAELLNVTPQAVSKWENETGLPDISQLPLLSAVFDVSSDEILGINIQKNEKVIDEIINKSIGFGIAGESEKSVKILEDGLKKFPRSFKLMVSLAKALGVMPERTGDVVKLCRRVLAECSDKEVCDDALYYLIYAYDNSGDHERALEYAHKLPRVWYAREETLMFLLNGGAEGEKAEALENLRDFAEFCTERLMLCLEKMSNKAFGYSDDDRLKLLGQLVSVGETVFCDGDYDFDAQFIAIGYRRMAEIYAERLEVEKTLECLEKECRLRIHFDTYDMKRVKTSLAVRGCPAAAYAQGNGNQSSDMLERLESDVYDFVRNHTRFSDIAAELQKYSK